MLNYYYLSLLILGVIVCFTPACISAQEAVPIESKKSFSVFVESKSVDALCARMNEVGNFTAGYQSSTTQGDLGKLRPNQRELVGITSCTRCHQNALPANQSLPLVSSPVAEDDPSIIPNIPGGGTDGWYLGNEITTWRTYDKHAQAYAALKGELAQTMAKILSVMENGESQIHRDVRCLACHASAPVAQLLNKGKPVEVGDPRIYKTKLIANLTEKSEVLKKGEIQFDQLDRQLQFGVSCEACHGPGGTQQEDKNKAGWGDQHYTQPDWRTRTSSQKFEAGMWDVHSFVNKAKICSSCHIGDAGQGKVVTHEMYAAGHPPLPNFEVSTFSNQEPVHWRTIYRKDAMLLNRYMQDAQLADPLPEDAGRLDIAESTTGMLVGGLVNMSQQLRLSADLCQINKSDEPNLKDEYPLSMNWPEFSTFACFNCHHDLKVDSWRQKRTPMLKPGRPNMHEWPFTTVAISVRHLGQQAEYEQMLKGVFDALNKTPFGDHVTYPEQCLQLANWLESQAWALSRKPLRSEQLPQVMQDVLRLGQEIGRDYDSMRQFIWAFSVVYDEHQYLSGQQKEMVSHHTKLGGWYKDVKGQSEIQQVLAEMNSIMVLDLNGGHFSKQTIVKLNTNNQGGSLTVKPYLADLTQILPKISAYEAEQLLQKFAKLEELLKKLH